MTGRKQPSGEKAYIDFNSICRIDNYHPLLIDISSGLEQNPGKKDPKKIKKFFGEILNFT